MTGLSTGPGQSGAVAVLSRPDGVVWLVCARPQSGSTGAGGDETSWLHSPEARRCRHAGTNEADGGPILPLDKRADWGPGRERARPKRAGNSNRL